MEEYSSAIILAAGKSERMGKPKFALKFDNTRTFLEEIVERFIEFGCEEIIVVMNRAGRELFDKLKIQLAKNVKIAINPHPELGRFSSIKIGLNYSANRNSVFIHNIDNPFVNKKLLKLLLSQSGVSDYCVPVYKNRGGHPILISEKIVESINTSSKDDMNLREYLMAFERIDFEGGDPKILVNINTPGEYGELFPNIKA